MNLYRGYLPEGKDRQHPVNDPDASDIYAMVPTAPQLSGIATWYAMSNVSPIPPVFVDTRAKW